MKKFVLLVMAALLAFAFSPAQHSFAQGKKVVRVTLIDENGSGEDGSAQLTDQGDGTTKVELIMLNAPEGAVQPAHIHKGTCANLDPAPQYPLESVTNGRSTTIVKASLTDLTNDKHAINVHESAQNPRRYVSCGNLPSGAAMSGGAMTMDQVMSTLIDQAMELEGTIKKKEADASQNAYDAFHTTFAANENDIKAKNADAQMKIEDAMHEVRDELQKGDFDGAFTAADQLVGAVKEAQGMMGGESMNAGGAMSMSDAMSKLQTQAHDLVRETINKDSDGSQRAYDAFHETFAANENDIKAKNPEAQMKIEDAMHEVRDAIKAGDFAKAATAADELEKEVKDAMGEMSIMSSPSMGGGDNMPGTGAADLPLTLAALSGLGLTLTLAGTALRRRTAK